jgi:hypothetical protein
MRSHRSRTPYPFVLSPGGSMSKDEASNLYFDKLSTNGLVSVRCHFALKRQNQQHQSLFENVRLQAGDKLRRLIAVDAGDVADMGDGMARLTVAQKIFDAAQQQGSGNILCIGNRTACQRRSG